MRMHDLLSMYRGSVSQGVSSFPKVLFSASHASDDVYKIPNTTIHFSFNLKSLSSLTQSNFTSSLQFVTSFASGVFASLNFGLTISCMVNLALVNIFLRFGG